MAEARRCRSRTAAAGDSVQGLPGALRFRRVRRARPATQLHSGPAMFLLRRVLTRHGHHYLCRRGRCR